MNGLLLGGACLGVLTCLAAEGEEKPYPRNGDNVRPYEQVRLEPAALTAAPAGEAVVQVAVRADEACARLARDPDAHPRAVARACADAAVEETRVIAFAD
jgi:hypothetical protein